MLPFLAGLALGLLPYLRMVLRSQADPVISFFGPLETWDQFWAVVSREVYAGTDDSQFATKADFAHPACPPSCPHSAIFGE